MCRQTKLPKLLPPPVICVLFDLIPVSTYISALSCIFFVALQVAVTFDRVVLGERDSVGDGAGVQRRLRQDLHDGLTTGLIVCRICAEYSALLLCVSTHETGRQLGEQNPSVADKAVGQGHLHSGNLFLFKICPHLSCSLRSLVILMLMT